MSKYLLFFLGLGGTAGAATFVSLTTTVSKKTQEEKKIQTKTRQGPESFQEKQEISTKPELGSEIELPSVSEQNSGFKGKLVFNKENKPKGVSRVANIFNKGELLSEEDKLEKTEEDDEQDKDDHITVNLSSTKSEEILNKALEELNKKIEEQSKGNDHLEKLKISLEDSESKDKFKEAFGEDLYQKLLEEVRKRIP